MIALLLDHLWQSSIFAGGAALLVFALRHNGANVRFWLWFAASIKFLVPFAALTVLGSLFLTPIVAPVAAPAVTLMAPLAKPFSAPAPALAIGLTAAVPALPVALPAAPAPHAFHPDLGSALLTLWILGFSFLALRWLVRWSRMRALLREAMDVQVDAPVAVKFSASRLEPGLVGILRPVILLPQGIEQQLSPGELRAVLAHELCHWRRHDNLLAAIHMLVEALFWFFPLVWWLGARLNAERERACDESVLAEGNDPQLYAEGILKVCRAYLQSPLACVAGVSGAGLKQRIDAIIENRLSRQLTAVRKMLLGASAAASIIAPLVLGLVVAPMTHVPAQAKAAIMASLNAGHRDEQAVVSAQGTTTPDQQTAKAPAVGTEAAASSQPTLPVPERQLVAPPVLPEPMVGPVQIALNNLPATVASASSDEPKPLYTCHNNSVFGRVISPEAIQMVGFACVGATGDGSASEARNTWGSCPLQSTDLRDYRPGQSGSCKFGVNMNVRLADPADAARLQLGTVVRLAGNFHVARNNNADYLTVANARILYIDPVGSAKDPATVCQPPELVEISRRVGVRLCVQKDILAHLDAKGPELQTAASSVIRQPYLDDFTQTSSGDLGAITCRHGSQFLTCARNSYWLSGNHLSSPMGQPPDIGVAGNTPTQGTGCNPVCGAP
jgi:beta-lactamase regulating signal transducer with metallopeptidase domain